MYNIQMISTQNIKKSTHINNAQILHNESTKPAYKLKNIAFYTKKLKLKNSIIMVIDIRPEFETKKTFVDDSPCTHRFVRTLSIMLDVVTWQSQTICLNLFKRIGSCEKNLVRKWTFQNHEM